MVGTWLVEAEVSSEYVDATTALASLSVPDSEVVVVPSVVAVESLCTCCGKALAVSAVNWTKLRMWSL